MPTRRIRGVEINYETFGDEGPWIALSPGGRRDLEGLRSLAGRLAAAGNRVVLHDRRNCGASEVSIEGGESEYQIWADDLHELLDQLGALPAWIGGGSSGSRLSLLFALREPASVLGLLLWRITGGEFAVNRLAKRYYTDYIEVARQGGMAAVCDTEHFRERIARRPANRDRLLAMDPTDFVAVMENWRRYFLEGVDQPVLGVTEEQLRGITIPTLVIPGNDNTHAGHVGETVHRLLPDSRIHVLYPDHQDVDLVPADAWAEKEEEMASVFLDFIRQHTPTAANDRSRP